MPKCVSFIRNFKYFSLLKSILTNFSNLIQLSLNAKYRNQIIKNNDEKAKK